MKKQQSLQTNNEHNVFLSGIIQKRDDELKELARKNGTHYAKRNQPSPLGDKLSNFTGELKTGYEKLASEISNHLQPQMHFPEAKMDADYYKEADENLQKEIDQAEHEINITHYELGEFNPKAITSRIRLALFLSIIIMAGDTLFNAKALQVVGENLLFALLLSFCISVGVLVFSHVVPFLYKATEKIWKRRLIILSSLAVATGLFTALAIFRSVYLALHDVHVSPINFVIINLFFFIVSALMSFYILPSWAEIKLNRQKQNLQNEIDKKRKRIKELKAERERIRETILKETKSRIRIVYHANYSIEMVRKMYHEAVEIFKSSNILNRSDCKIPDCFNDKISEPEMENVTFLLNNQKSRRQS